MLGSNQGPPEWKSNALTTTPNKWVRKGEQISLFKLYDMHSYTKSVGNWVTETFCLGFYCVINSCVDVGYKCVPYITIMCLLVWIRYGMPGILSVILSVKTLKRGVYILMFWRVYINQCSQSSTLRKTNNVFSMIEGFLHQHL